MENVMPVTIIDTFRSHARVAVAAALATLFVPVGAALIPVAAHAADYSDAQLDRAIAGTHRSVSDQARDRYRHPKETLRFFGVRPDMTVIEIAPGAGWYTDILAPFLRDHGHLYAAHYAASGPDSSDYRRQGRARYEAKLAANPALYGKVIVGDLPVRAFTDIQPPGGADMVLTFRNVHNWIKDGHFDDSLKAFYDVLKPGGVLGVEEHRAKPGTTVDRMIASGYVTEAYVIERAEAAGFKLGARSEINANARDTKDYPKGVWTLPPSYVEGERDKAKYAAIGESDRMTLRFVKPAAAR
jgi:predicted methyltransferase